MRKLFIQFSVTDGQYPVGIFGVGKAVCDKNDGFAAFVAGEKQFHYFLSGAAVKISARLVRKDKVGVCGDCSCDSDTLLLSSRKLIRLVRQPSRKSYSFKRRK